MMREPLILIAQDLAGTKWQWPDITVGPRGSRRYRSKIERERVVHRRESSRTRQEGASYWFDRRHVKQFDVRAQGVRTIEGEALTLLRILDRKMIDI